MKKKKKKGEEKCCNYGKGKWCFTSKRGQKLAITSFFMGLDKYENAKLIKYGFIEDIWLLFIKNQSFPFLELQQ
ncbi:hypothetical protein ERO13_D04G074266v2 [Gossypium hirsutum]|nr:hypothetical protein ERO13_D04G074266v2 [Gossypium hirsutum]KAG4151583.1 hypothetical protein ERO13_D04G074266v2 [Gossypium hirsutum]